MEDENFDELRPTWALLGLTQSEIDHEIEMYLEKLEEVKKQFVLNQKQKYEDFKQNILNQKESLIEILEAVQIPEKEIGEIRNIEQNSTWKNTAEKLQFYQNKYDSVISQRKGAFEEIFKLVSEHFDQLGIKPEERGEFQEIGTKDLSNARLERFKQKDLELAQIYETSKLQYLDKINQINELLKILGLETTEEIENLKSVTVYSPENFEKCDNEIKKLAEVVDEKKKEIGALAVRLTSLWDVLNTPDSEKQEILAQTDLSDASIQVVKDALAKYEAEKDERIGELIEVLINEIKTLGASLHLLPSNIEDLIEREDQDDHEYYDKLSNIVISLRKLLIKEKHCLEMISQREEIIKNSNENPKDEKAKMRRKSVLPRLEKKLKIALEDFYDENKENLMYDGVPYIDQLSNVIISKLERTSMSKLKKRKSLK